MGLETAQELTELRYATSNWSTPRGFIVVRQSIKRREASDKNLSLFADVPDIQG